MRTDIFGGQHITSTDECHEIADAIFMANFVKDDVYAIVEKDEETGKWSFEVLANEDGETVIDSDAIFDDEHACRQAVRGYVSSVQER